MEWLFYTIGYIAIGLVVGFFATKITYQESIRTNKNPIPRNSWSTRKHSTEEFDELETKRRKKLATEAMVAGFWVGVFWIITLPIMTVLLIAGLVFKAYFALAIKPTDKDFVSDKQLRKAQAIIARHERETREQFDKELGME